VNELVDVVARQVARQAKRGEQRSGLSLLNRTTQPIQFGTEGS